MKNKLWPDLKKKLMDLLCTTLYNHCPMPKTTYLYASLEQKTYLNMFVFKFQSVYEILLLFSKA